MIPKSGPGPIWFWITAWSLQGAGVMLIEQFAIEDAWVRIACFGVVAALPLVVLYAVLVRRAAGE